jgi:hypothetical protein
MRYLYLRYIKHGTTGLVTPDVAELAQEWDMLDDRDAHVGRDH